MGLDFYQEYSVARQAFEEADDLLKRPISKLIFEGSDQELTETKNSQPAIFITCYALMRVLQSLFPEIQPSHAAGLSLGEYTALTAANVLGYATCLPIVQARGLYMHECCERHPGTMAVALGLDDSSAEQCVDALQLPNDLWAANFNCPGQVVISGTKMGVEKGSKALQEKGAKKVLPLQVHGAFHSGLMREAQEQLGTILAETQFQKSSVKVAMNVTGTFITDTHLMKKVLIEQVTKPVRWSRCIQAIDQDGIDVFIEIGCGKTLSGMNKRIGVRANTINLEKIEDLKNIELSLRNSGA